MEFEKPSYRMSMHIEEQERIEYMPDVVSSRLLDGMGFGEGKISHLDRRADVGEELLSQVESLFETPEILVPVDINKETGKMLDDDGCPDGRGVRRVLEGTLLRNKSLHRPKVFGGGTAMTTAVKIGSSDYQATDLQGVFTEATDLLEERGLNYGGHTDGHAHGPNCGCGALDRAPDIIKNAVKYREEIGAVIAALGGDMSSYDEIIAGYEQASQLAADTYSGRAVIDTLTNKGKVVKELDGDHLEMYVLLNTVEGHTVDQSKVREVSNGDVQVFGVDVWRLRQLANTLLMTPELQERAYVSMLVYSLATAATLTKGDLPVYSISDAKTA